MHLIGSVLFDANEQVAAYVSAKTGGAKFSRFCALGIVKKERLVGGVVFHECQDFQSFASIALDEDAGFCPWRTLFAYPFHKLGYARLTSLIEKKNKKSRALCERLGFKLEGVHPRAIDGSTSIAMSYGMLKEHCRWIKGR